MPITDTSFTLTTGQSGVAEYATPEISGFLEAIFLKTDGTIAVYITIKNTGIVVWKAMNVQGEHYLPLRVGCIDRENGLLNFAATRWALNDSLIISVQGGFNQTVSCTIRVEAD